MSNPLSQSAVNKVEVFSNANPEHAIASLRLIAPLSEAGIEINWRMPDQEFDRDQLSECDLVIIQRDYPRFVDQYYRVHRETYQLNIPVIFEIDDLLWELPDEHPDRETKHYTDALIPMMFAAWASDGITAASEGIREYISWLNPKIYVLPNYLNSKLWDFRKPQSEEKKSVSIGYMGGDSHKPDLEMIETVLQKVFHRYQDRVRFISWGVQPPDSLKEHPQVEWIPLQPGDYATFAEYFNKQEFDIYLSPLKNNQFNRCKSSIKVLEYTSLGIPGVSSDVEPYQNVIDPGENGLLAESIDDWESHLTTLIENPEMRFQFAIRAQEAVRKEWLISDHSYLWQQAYKDVINSYSPREEVPQILEMMQSILSQTLDHKRQLEKDLASHQSKLAYVKASRSWKAGQALRTIYNRILLNKQTPSGEGS